MKHHTTCPLCEAGCGLVIETDAARSRVLKIEPDREDPLSQGHMCVKAHALPRLHEDPDRLRLPVRRTATGWEELSWDDALDLAADKLHGVRSKHGNDAVAMYLGNPTVHNYEGLLGAVALGGMLRTKNRYAATSTDQLPQMLAGLKMFGHQLMLPVPDIDRTDFMVLLGANPLASNGSIMTAPGVGRKLRAIQKRGGKVVVIDPRRTETAALSDQHLAIRPGTDPLFLLAVLHVLFRDELATLGAVEAFTSGFMVIRGLAQEYSPEVVADTVGLHGETIEAFAHEFAGAKSSALYARVGACTQRFGGVAAWLAWVVNACSGRLDVPGGMMFTRPAIDAVAFAGAIGMRGTFDTYRSRVRGLPEFGGEFPVATLADEIETPGDGQVRGLLTMAGNPVSSAPNGDRIGRVLDKLDAMVSVDFYINETTRHADVILPPVSQLQRPYLHFVFGMFSVRRTAKASAAVLERGPDERTDSEILLGLTQRLLHRAGGGWHAASLLVGLLERRDLSWVADLLLRLGPTDLTYKKLAAYPHGVDLGELERQLPERLLTKDKRIDLAPDIYRKAVLDLKASWKGGELDGGLRLIGRRNLRSNNSWMHNVKPVSGAADCNLLMHPDDAAEHGVRHGELVTLGSRTGAVVVVVEVTDSIRPGVVSLPHGHGHDREGVRMAKARQHGGVSVNAVTDDQFLDELTGNAAFNGVPVSVSPFDGE